MTTADTPQAPVRQAAVLLCLLTHAGLLPAADNPSILLNIEEPRPAVSYQGVANLRGWAVAPLPLERIEVYLDDVYAFDVPLGGNREDVGNAFPNYPNADRSGFAMAFNYGDHAAGSHELLVRAIDSNGDWRERRVQFRIERFADNYVEHPTERVRIDPFDTSFIVRDATGFAIQGLEVNGGSYDLELRWRNQAQSFVIEQITP
jgi:hypothetical protein